MNTAINSRKMKLMAGVAALVATLFTAGGTLALADGYARMAADGKTAVAGNSAPQQVASSATIALAD